MTPDLFTQSYDYSLPKECIAYHPAIPADSAKLLIYDRQSDTVTHSTFSKFLDFIPKECAIFLNDTKVIKARIYGQKESGGKVELLLDRELIESTFAVYIKGKVSVGTFLHFHDKLDAKVIKLASDGSRVVEFFQNGVKIDFFQLTQILEKIGHVPLPPYIQREDTREDIADYQTLFAKKSGAVAAPTASLHFTPELLNKMKENFPTKTLTLHVGSGTFKSVESEEILAHDIHSEIFHIPQDSMQILNSNQPLLAIGTTVTRTIEYYHATQKNSGECNIFLHPFNQPKRVNHLLTNFHLPKSTLIMLVASFIGREKTLQLYKTAIENSYKFYSYGDAMLII